MFVFGEGVGSKRNDGDTALCVIFEPTDDFGGSVSVQLGHLNVHQHGIISARGSLRENPHAFFAVAGAPDGNPGLLQDFQSNFGIKVVVFRQKDSAVFEFRSDRKLSLVDDRGGDGRRLIQAERKFDGENGTAPQGAGNGNRAA